MLSYLHVKPNTTTEEHFTHDAEYLYDECLRLGIDTAWWYEKANRLILRSAIDHTGAMLPSEAYLLLPYSVVRLLNPFDDDGDNLPKSSFDTIEDKRFYERTIRLYLSQGLVKDAANSPRAYVDFPCWFFQGSKAITPNLDADHPDAMHLAYFTDVRGLSQLINGNPGANLNIVKGLDSITVDPAAPNGLPSYDDETAYVFGGTTPLIWSDATTVLWQNAIEPLDLSKYTSTPTGFTYPEFPDIDPTPETAPGNPAPQNLELLNMSAWEALTRYCQLIGHNLNPKHDGTFTAELFHAHTDETFTVSASDKDKAFKEFVGREISQLVSISAGSNKPLSRVDRILDASQEPRIPLLPYSFVGVFSRNPVPGEPVVLLPVVLHRGFPPFTSTNVDASTSKQYLTDTDFFPEEYLAAHPYVFSGDASNGFLTANEVFLDLTFFCNLASAPAPFNDKYAAATVGDEQNSYNYPKNELLALFAKRHLKAMLHGDLGTVIAAGWNVVQSESETSVGPAGQKIGHLLMPTSRHQTVIYSLERGSNGRPEPVTKLIGAYVSPGPYVRKPSCRTQPTLGTGGSSGAVYLATTTADIPAGDGDSSGSGTTATVVQITEDGAYTDAATLLSYDSLVILNPFPYVITAGLHRVDLVSVVFGETTIAYFEFQGLDLSGLPDWDAELAQALTHNDSDGQPRWAELDLSGVNVPGAPGAPGSPGAPGADGQFVSEGYAIDLVGTGTLIDPKQVNYNPTEITGFASNYQFFVHNSAASARTDPNWETITLYDNTKVQAFIQYAGTWKALTINGFNSSINQVFGHLVGTWHAKTVPEWLQDYVPSFSGAVSQYLGHAIGGPPVWVAGPPTYTAGCGLSLASNVFSVNVPGLLAVNRGLVRIVATGECDTIGVSVDNDTITINGSGELVATAVSGATYDFQCGLFESSGIVVVYPPDICGDLSDTGLEPVDFPASCRIKVNSCQVLKNIPHDSGDAEEGIWIPAVVNGVCKLLPTTQTCCP